MVGKCAIGMQGVKREGRGGERGLVVGWEMRPAERPATALTGGSDPLAVSTHSNNIEENGRGAGSDLAGDG